jgi:hypothetical protein
MSGSQSQLVIAFDARIGRLEGQLNKANAALTQTNRAARQAQASVSTMSASFNRIGTGLSGFGAMARSAFAPLVAIFAGGALLSGITSAVTNINNLADAAGQIGLQAPSLQAIQIAFQEAGSNAETASQGIGRLATMVGDAVRGGKEAQEAFTKVGVSFQNIDGSARTTQEVFDAVGVAIRGAASEQEKMSIAAQFFGERGARAAVAAYAEMDGSTSDLIDRYRQLGLVIGPETAQRLDAVGTAFANLGRAIATSVAEGISRYAEQLVTFANNAREGYRSFVDNFVTPVTAKLDEIVGTVGPVVVNIVTAITNIIRAVAEQLQPVFQFVLSNLRRIAEQAQIVINFVGRIIGRVLNQVGIFYGTAVQQAEQALTQSEGGLERASSQLAATESSLRQAQERLGNVTNARVRATLEQEIAGYQQRISQQRANLTGIEAQVAEARAALQRERESAAEAARTPVIPPATQIPTTSTSPAAPPRVTAQSGGRSGRTDAEREEERRINELNQRLQRLFESTRTPMEEFSINIDRMWEAVSASGSGGVNALAGGLDTVQRAVLQFGEDAAKNLRALGAEGLPQLRALEQMLIELGPRVLASSSAEDLEAWRDRVARVLSDTKEKATDFWSSFQRGLGIDGEQKSLDQTLGEGLGKMTGGAFDTLLSTLDKIAEGSVKAGDALKQFALGFVRDVAKMAAQAAAMRLISTFLGGGAAGAPRAGGAAPAPAINTRFGGARMAGGATSGGFAYLIGERGPEIWTAPGAGRVIPNSELGGGGMQVIVNQNAPGVVVEQRQIDPKTVMLAVNLSRQQVAADFAESARTGHGSYAEPLQRGFAVRRRL